MLFFIAFLSHSALAEDDKANVNPSNQPAKADTGAALSPEAAIEKYTTNITKLFHEGAVDPFIGRENEIANISEIMDSSKFLILIGDRGSGKTQLVYNAAGRLNGKTMRLLSMSTLYAGSKYRGDLEERIKPALEYLVAHPEEIVVVDEAANFGNEENAKLRDALLPLLSEEKISGILITTADEFMKSSPRTGP